MTTASNRWTASWIWDRRGLGDAERQVVAARRTVHLGAVPASAPGRIFAEAHYVLFVNGSEVHRGPGRANPRCRRYDRVDLAPWLRAGANAITVIAAIDRRASRNWSPAPTLMSQLADGAVVAEFELGLGLDELIVTDETWWTTTLRGWSLSEPTGMISRRGLELIDAGDIPLDLHDAVLAPGAPWRPAEVRSGRTMGDPEGVRAPSYPLGPTEVSTLSLPSVTLRPLEPGPHGTWMLPDIGSGTIVVELEGPADAIVEIDTFETLDDRGTPRPMHEPIGLRVTAAPQRTTVETLDLFGLRGAVVQVPDGVTVHGVALRERTHPVIGGARFECSDPVLNQLYTVGRRTVTLCSADAYVDTPTREGRAWVGDSVVHGMVDLVTNSDWTLARWNPRLAALSALPDGILLPAVGGDGESGELVIIPDWALHWVHAVWTLYRYAGDADEIADLLPAVERVLDWFERHRNPLTGLPTDVPGWVLIDWAWVPVRGASCTLAGLLGRALLEFAEMAEWLADAGRAARARRRHADLAAGFERFWDERLGRYADELRVDGNGTARLGTTASQHGQAAALVGGFAPADRRARLVQLLSDTSLHVHATLSVPDGDPGMTGMTGTPGAQLMMPGIPEPWWDADRLIVMAQPFFRYIVHDALSAAGRDDLVTGMLHAWEPLLDRHPTSFGETFWGGSVAHGWSSTPTRDLVTKVLGITPAEPGYAVVRVAPALGDLEWAEGVVPIPQGEIRVRPDAAGVEVDSPVPVLLGGRRWEPGRFRTTLTAQIDAALPGTAGFDTSSSDAESAGRRRLAASDDER